MLGEALVFTPLAIAGVMTPVMRGMTWGVGWTAGSQKVKLLLYFILNEEKLFYTFIHFMERMVLRSPYRYFVFFLYFRLAFCVIFNPT